MTEHDATVRCCVILANPCKGGGKRIHERLARPRLHPLAAPSARKGPYADPCQTRGRCFPHKTCIVGRIQERETRSSPNDNVL